MKFPFRSQVTSFVAIRIFSYRIQRENVCAMWPNGIDSSWSSTFSAYNEWFWCETIIHSSILVICSFYFALFCHLLKWNTRKFRTNISGVKGKIETETEEVGAGSSSCSSSASKSNSSERYLQAVIRRQITVFKEITYNLSPLKIWTTHKITAQCSGERRKRD